MRARWAAVLLFALAPIAVARAADVRLSMSASSNRVRVGEPFALEIRAELNGRGSDEEIELPDFGRLEVLARQISRPFSFSFGFGSGGQHAQVHSEVVYSFTVRAPAPGTYTIQPAVITVGGRRFASRPLTIEASGAPLPPGAQQNTDDQDDQDVAEPPEGPLDGARFDPDMFVRTVVDKRQAYVGEQVTVTVYLYVRGMLRDTPVITREPTSEGFWTQDLLPTQRSLSAVRQQVNGRSFSAYVMRRFAAFPMRAGTLHIGATSVEVGSGNSIFDLLNGPSEPLRRNGVQVDVEVKEPPARKDASAPVHVGQLELAASLDPTSAKVGDAITLQVTAKGLGNLRALELASPRIPGVDVLPPEIHDDVTMDLDRVGGTRVFRWLLLPRQGGQVEIPGMRVDVLDPRTGNYAAVTTPALTAPVIGAPASAGAPTQPAAQPSSPDSAAAAQPPLSFGPARSQAALLRARPPLHREPWFWWAVLAGPATFALALGARSLARVRTVRAARGDAAGRSLRAADDHLQAAQAARERGDTQELLSRLTQALKAALETRLQQAIGGLTVNALRRQLETQGVPAPVAQRALAQLENLELARFAPAPKTEREVDQLLSEVRACTRELVHGGAKP